MPDPTPAAAVTATPAAAPATPAVTPPAAAAPPVAPPAAPAPPAATPPAVAPPAAVVPAVTEPSLLSTAGVTGDPAAAAPQTEAEKIAAARELIRQAEAAADPNSGKAWLLTDGVMGQGEKPTWLNTAKYKTVAAQAEAYTHLETRFGSFVGAPKDGKYTVDEALKGFVNPEAPMAVEFAKWAASKQLSQEGYNELYGFLVQHEQSLRPKMDVVLARLGPDAGPRINTTAAWVKANLGAEGFATFNDATKGSNADAVFRLVESLVAKSGQVRMPKPGDDVPGAQPAGLAAAQKAHAERDANGKLKVDTVPGYRAQVEKMYRDAQAA